MLLAPETAVRLVETASQRVRRLAAGAGVYREPSAYFEPGEARPGDPGYFELFERRNDAFPEWLDPGRVAAPETILRQGSIFSFPSPLPTGEPALDRVHLKVYPAPAAAPPVGVLFHHWIGLGSWLPVDWLLAPLTRRYRVAVMVAPHHLMRRRAGMRSGEGFINPNPRHMFESLRQWLADHLACLELLNRDHGFAAAVIAGYSLGGFGILASRLVRPPQPAVIVCPTNSFYRGVFEGTHTDQLARRVREAGFTRESFRRATRGIHLARWGDRIPGRELTWIYAAQDGVEPEYSLRESREAIRPQRVVELAGGHTTTLFYRRRIVEEIARRVETVNLA